MDTLHPDDPDRQETDERPPLTGFAAELYQMALASSEPFALQAELSLELEAIAERLIRCAWLMTGKPTMPPWSELSRELQNRYRYLAERAIATIDPAVRLKLQADAAAETETWLDGPGCSRADAVSGTDIANYAIGLYEAKLAGVRVERAK